MQKNNILLGVILTLLATLTYSCQAALVKAYAGALSLPVIIFMQSATGLLFLLPLIFHKGRQEAAQVFKTNKIHLHILRTFSSMAISYLLFISVQYIPLVNAVLLANTAPMIVPFLAFLFLGNKINHRLWLPLFIGFVGISLVLQPDKGIFELASFLALGAALAMATSVLIVRYIIATDSPKTTTTYFFIFSTIFAGILAIPFWTPLTAKLWGILFVIGTLYFLCQYFMTIALRHANAQLISSLFYSNIIYSAIISNLFWHNTLSLSMWLGIVLTVFGGILCIFVERKQLRRQQQDLKLERESYGTEKTFIERA